MVGVREEESGFSLRGGSSEFSCRTAAVFGALQGGGGEESRRYTEEELERDEAKSKRKVVRSPSTPNTARLQGKESIFKTPSVPRRGGGGSWLKRSLLEKEWKDPKKWKHYSLSGVEQLSESGNTSAALDFLTQLARGSSSSDMETEGEKGPVFRRPMTEGVETETMKDKGRFVEGRYTMPEYQVGKTPPPKAKPVQSKPTSSVQTNPPVVTLSHLIDEIDE